jgi:LysM repeat protein
MKVLQEVEMNAYRFSRGGVRSGYKVLSILLLVAFLFSPQMIPVQAAGPRPEGNEPSPARTEPAALAVSQPAINCEALHEYQAGETLAQIAQSYQVTVEELRFANPWLANLPLQADSSLCIPASTLIKYHDKAKLYAYVILGHLTVWGEGFPKYHRYNVRVMADRSNTWYKIGYLDSAKNGSILKYLKLPKAIRYPHKLKVCLKELDTSWTICTKAEIARFGIYP